jgi:hypothetical protein
MKMKHNKKRNTAFLFETLTRELTKEVLKKDKDKQNKVIAIIKEFFNKDRILYKELQLYKYLLETKKMDEYSAEKLVYEVKKEHAKLNKRNIFNEQSRLISKINKIFGQQAFSNFVPKYKSLASIAQMFDDATALNKKIMLEKKIVGYLTTSGQQKKREEEIKNSTIKSFVKIFNQSYSSLLEEQRSLLQKYINPGPDSLEFKAFLNEEAGRIKEVIKKSLRMEEIKNDKNMQEKCREVLKMVEEFKDKEINEAVVSKIMKLQKLAKEILS